MKLTDAAPGQTGATHPFSLRLTGDTSFYTGQFEFEPASDRLAVNVDVAGGTNDDGFAVLSGSRTVGAWNLTRMDVRELAVKVDDTVGLLGRIQFSRASPDSTDRYVADILSASLQVNTAYPGGSVEGHWVGRAISKDCSGWCVGEAGVNITREIELVLKQSGTVLSGSGTFETPGCGVVPGCWLPLEGFADGQAIRSLSGRLTNERIDGSNAGDRVMKVSDFTATVDDLGRMRATFVYSTEGWHWQPNGPPKLLKVSSSLNMESIWLTREP